MALWSLTARTWLPHTLTLLTHTRTHTHAYPQNKKDVQKHAYKCSLTHLNFLLRQFFALQLSCNMHVCTRIHTVTLLTHFSLEKQWLLHLSAASVLRSGSPLTVAPAARAALHYLHLPNFHSVLHIPSGHPYSQTAPNSLQSASIATAEPSHTLFTRRPQSHDTLCFLCCYLCLEILLTLISLLTMFSAPIIFLFFGN